MRMAFAGWGLRFAAPLLATTVLAGCDDSPPPPPQDFPALHYDYLAPIRLNVADVEVDDQSTSPDGDLAGRSPFKPAQAMQQMAHDRLIAAGAAGSATFVVTEASITRTDNGITEHLAARLEISNASGGHAGFAEAHVTRTETPGNGEPAGPASLYELTRQAMEDMNVEFEYQVRHTLHDWLITNGAVEAPVEQAPLVSGAPAPGAPALGAPALDAPALDAPALGAPALGAPVPGAPLPLAPGGAPGPATPPGAPGFTPGEPTTLTPPPPALSTGSPGLMSPPPGYLAAPPGAAPLSSAPSAYAPAYPPPAPYGPAPYGNVPPSSQAYPAAAPQNPTGY